MGTGNHAVCVCLGETLTSSPRGSQWSFSSKDIEFPEFLNCDKKKFEKFSSKYVLLPGGHGFSHVVACSRLSDTRDDA